MSSGGYVLPGKSPLAFPSDRVATRDFAALPERIGLSPVCDAGAVRNRAALFLTLARASDAPIFILRSLGHLTNAESSDGQFPSRANRQADQPSNGGGESW